MGEIARLKEVDRDPARQSQVERINVEHIDANRSKARQRSTQAGVCPAFRGIRPQGAGSDDSRCRPTVKRQKREKAL